MQRWISAKHLCHIAVVVRADSIPQSLSPIPPSLRTNVVHASGRHAHNEVVESLANSVQGSNWITIPINNTEFYSLDDGGYFLGARFGQTSESERNQVQTKDTSCLYL